MAALNSCKVPHNRLNMQQLNMTMKATPSPLGGQYTILARALMDSLAWQMCTCVGSCQTN